MASTRLQTFIRFSADTVGLERILRMIQAVLQVIIAYPLLLYLASAVTHPRELASTDRTSQTAARVADLASTRVALSALRREVSLGRRFLRFFRFIDNFHAAHQLYASSYTSTVRSSSSTSSSPPHKTGPSLETWLDIFSRSFNGMYLLLESVTLLEAMEIDGLALWEPELSRVIHVEAQRFWFVSLVCSIAAGCVKMVNLFAHAPVPAEESGHGLGGHGEKDMNDQQSSAENTRGSDVEPVAGEKHEQSEKDKLFNLQEERARLRQVVKARRAMRLAWRRNVMLKGGKLVRRMWADVFDLAIPGAVVGWVNLDAGILGLIQIVSTYLTGKEVWDRIVVEMESSPR